MVLKEGDTYCAHVPIRVPTSSVVHREVAALGEPQDRSGRLNPSERTFPRYSPQLRG